MFDMYSLNIRRRIRTSLGLPVDWRKRYVDSPGDTKSLSSASRKAVSRHTVEFCFLSNRPISANLMEAVEDAAAESTSRHPNTLRKLEEFTSLSGERLSAFCKLLRLEGALGDYWLQRADLGRETNGYLPGNDVDAPVQLKELVTQESAL